VRRLTSMPRFPSMSGRIWPAAAVIGLSERPGSSRSEPTYATAARGSSWRPTARRSSGWRRLRLRVRPTGRVRSYPASVSSTCYSSFPSGGARESAGSSWMPFSPRRGGGTTHGFTSGRTKSTSVRTVSTAAGASRQRAEPWMARANGRARFDGIRRAER